MSKLTPQLLELQKLIHDEMPISRAMGFEVLSWEAECLSLVMPLQPNRNPHHTAFAGSLASLCTAVGWGTVHLLQEQEGFNKRVVIGSMAVRFVRPVSDERIVARSYGVDQLQIAYCFDQVLTTGRGLMEVRSAIYGKLGPLVTFTGSYFIIGH